MEAVDCVFEIDRVEKGNGAPAFNEVDSFVWLTTGQEDEKHGHDTCRPLHPCVAMDEDRCSSVIFGGHAIYCLK